MIRVESIAECSETTMANYFAAPDVACVHWLLERLSVNALSEVYILPLGIPWSGWMINKGIYANCFATE